MDITSLLCFSSCQNKSIDYVWSETKDNQLFRCPINEASVLSYKWSGACFYGLIHGDGIITACDELGQTKWTKRVCAYYGAIDSTDIKKGKGFQYIGDLLSKQSDDNSDKIIVMYDGFGVYIEKDCLYIGDFKSNNKTGKGKLFVDNNLQYEGDFVDNYPDGLGVLYNEDGTKREGVFKNGKLYQSKEDITFENGRYVGYVENNQRSGNGVMYYNDSSYYDGEWKNNMKNGEGIYKSKNFEYKGTFKNNEFDGLGRLIYLDSSYEGEWKMGKRDGKGTQFYTNSVYYTGSWVQDEHDGYGELYVTNENIFYKGYFKKNLQNGEGKYKCKEYEYDGNWENGWMNGKGVIRFSNGDRYEGEFVENQIFGKGIYYFANGNTYEGEFIDNQMNGLGIFTFKNGNFYQGTFQDGKFKGDGTFYCKDSQGRITSLTAFWNGDNTIPNKGSLLFDDGDLYQGELINGRPTLNGTWYNEEERFGGNINQTVQKANDYYKKHQEEIDNYVQCTQIGLNALTTICVLCAPFTGGATLTIAAGARTFNIGIAVGNAVLHITSVAATFKDQQDYNEDVTETTLLFAKEVFFQSLNIVASITPGAPKVKGIDNRTATGVTRKMNAQLNKLSKWVKDHSKTINKYGDEIFVKLESLYPSRKYKEGIKLARKSFNDLLKNPDKFFNDGYSDVAKDVYANWKKEKKLRLLGNAAINSGWITVRENILTSNKDRKDSVYSSLSDAKHPEKSKIRIVCINKKEKTRGVGMRIVSYNDDKQQYSLDTLKTYSSTLKEIFERRKYNN